MVPLPSTLVLMKEACLLLEHMMSDASLNEAFGISLIFMVSSAESEQPSMVVIFILTLKVPDFP